DVRPELPGHAQRGVAAAGVAHDVEAVEGGQEAAQRGTYPGVVLDDQYPDRLVTGSGGHWAPQTCSTCVRQVKLSGIPVRDGASTHPCRDTCRVSPLRTGDQAFTDCP